MAAGPVTPVRWGGPGDPTAHRSTSPRPARVGEAPRRPGLVAPAAYAGLLVGLLLAALLCAAFHDQIAPAVNHLGGPR